MLARIEVAIRPEFNDPVAQGALRRIEVAEPAFRTQIRWARAIDVYWLDLPVTLYEAVLGAKVRVPTLDGAVQLAIPPNTSSGRTFRLKGKGLGTKSGAGDLLATVRIRRRSTAQRRDERASSTAAVELSRLAG